MPIDAEAFLEEIKEAIEEKRRRSFPSPTLEIYCDQYHGMKMVPTVSWGMGQYDVASADINPFYRWRCPKPGCDRLYDPTSNDVDPAVWIKGR